MAVPLASILFRTGLGLLLFHDGYFFGQGADTFARTELSWQWSHQPFLLSGSPYWLPLQFALVGGLFRLLRPLIHTPEIAVPLVVNHLFLLGSLTITFLVARRLAGTTAGIIASVLATTMAYDVWMTLSAYSEPITIFLSLMLGYLLLHWADTKRAYLLISMGAVAALLASNHYVGWFLSLPVLFILASQLLRNLSHHTSSYPRNIAAPIGALLVAGSFPALWLFANFYQYGDPFHFIRGSAEYHAHLRTVPLSLRLLAVPNATWRAEPGLALLALITVPSTLKQGHRMGLYLLPYGFHFFLLTASSILLLSPAYYMPRATLPYLWASLPFSAAAIVKFSSTRSALSALAAKAVVGALMVTGILRVFQYANIVTPDLRSAASVLRNHFDRLEGTAAIDVQQGWLPDALAVLSGHPDRLIALGDREIRQIIDSRGSSTLGDIRLLVLTNPMLVHAAERATEFVASFGDYVIVRPGRSSTFSVPVPRDFQGWSTLEDSQFTAFFPPDQMAFGFGGIAPRSGQQAGIILEVAAERNGCYIFEAEAKDFSDQDGYPWQFLEQFVVNDIVLWSHDVAADRFAGWQRISFYIMPISDRVTLQFRILALASPQPGFQWQRAGMMAIRSPRFRGCD